MGRHFPFVRTVCRVPLFCSETKANMFLAKSNLIRDENGKQVPGPLTHCALEYEPELLTQHRL
jgi:hypothetical protein